MKIIDIHDYTALPSEFRLELLSYKTEFEQAEYLETLLDRPRFRALADDIEKWILKNSIRVYHCTRAESPDSFLQHGLRVLDGSAHQQNFLRKFGHVFTQSERAELENAWKMAEINRFTEVRYGRLYFCVSKGLLNSTATDDLFEYFGGEAIYYQLSRDSTALKKLRALGTPLVVEAVIPASEMLKVATSFSQTMLSNYHASLNPVAHIYKFEGYVVRDVAATELIRVRPPSEYL